MSHKAVFEHRNYSLIDGDKIVRSPSAPPLTAAEDGEILQELARFIEAKLISEYKFESIQVSEDENPSTSILGSPNWINATKLLLIVQNAYGSQLGIFSRSICFDEGISKGTWLSYIQRAISVGYEVLVLRPNTNSITLDPKASKTPNKIPIKGSESPEIHALNVWENIVSRAESVTHIALLGYGNGASLCKDLYLREMVNADSGAANRIKAIVAIEASSIVSKDDSQDVQEALANLTINLELNTSASMGHRLAYRREHLGCVSLSLGMPPGVTHLNNVAAGVTLALHTVFKFLAIVESCPNPSKTFPTIMARDNGLDATTAVVLVNPAAVDEPTPLPASGNHGSRDTKVHISNATPPPPPTAPKKATFLSRIFGGGSGGDKGGKTGTASNEDKLTVADFDLLKIVGKGAFGKVMLVRKKTDNGTEGQVYAMKVLKKSAISAQGQVENTKSEREILFEVRHPYIVRLRYAFQSDDKLYLITDYYNGGTLFYHLRKAESFPEDRARFYAAQLLSALDHLHQQNIIYRDLKLENVLMDHQGHLALTDFGLSKQNIDATGGATTFCGTAEYIAPELLKGLAYGPAVDWWSFGILLYEMLYGRTPFWDKNRKLMFYRITTTEPTYPSTFSPAACECIRGLLRPNEWERLGSGPSGAEEIMKTAFFAEIDFAALYRREIPPPFTPEVTNEFDTKYVPKKYLQAEAKDSFEKKPKQKGYLRGNRSNKDNNPTFDAFTYQGDQTLDN